MTHSRLVRFIAFLMVVTLMVSITAAAFAYETIPYGEQSDTVRKMQKKLKSKGFYRGAVDGKFGPSTKSAVRKFQASVGLRGDGKPGNKTLTALYEGTTALNKTSNTERKQTTDIKNPRSLYYGCTGSRVRSLQKALKAAGYFKGTVDGVYGDLTFSAVKRYQSAHGLHSDGIAGVKTIARLNGSQSYAKVSTSMSLTLGSSGEEVKHLQQFLDGKGVTNTDAAGVFGASTQAALKQWQASNGLDDTGSFSEKDYNYYVVD